MLQKEIFYWNKYFFLHIIGVNIQVFNLFFNNTNNNNDYYFFYFF